MEDKLTDIGNAILERANRIENTRKDPFSRVARGVLGVERYIANRLIEKENKYSVPQELEFITKKQDKFMGHLSLLQQTVLREYYDVGNYTPPEAIPTINMCGYGANALVEASREKGLKARVVYGHYRSEGEVVAHYWKEVFVKGENYVVDSTYGQFDPQYRGKMHIYPAADLEKYGLREFTIDTIPVLKSDISTLEVLEENDGLLPLRDDIRKSEVTADYIQLVNVFK